ncbi:isopenicillin N synthase family oxygenase [Chelatococcus sambhunathii]|uniref:2-oxoglutarate-dependent ethylene/succinate-forming enzyme n=1 Tax=Chelatococcus sambhunathii TaxID=363953 RepID=A0ABU1DKV6_9HYPH|nr:2OG-Fe(II) oxygenase family protein [Chelatococcus sambhunathii]MDR4308599.1 isopenicillin N synthase family oxygenase [Chelatococcus sambhunathii]
MKDFANQVSSAASTLLHSGYAVIRTGPLLKMVLDDVFDGADAFFARGLAEKTRYARPEILEGYRGYGAEFSGSVDRPDLNETFSLVLRNMIRPEVADWARTNPLRRALAAAAPIYAELADAILDDLRRHFAPEGDRIASAKFSYLQLNYYRPGREERELLQDAHEDGHLLTFVTSRQPGLEFEVDGRFEPARLAPDEILVMPGGILSLMTGGAMAPLVHRVRKAPDLPRRASLMFFVNADVMAPPRPWRPMADGSCPDIRQATIESSQMFGLASIGALAE